MLLGPNGAGKTTLLSLAATALAPDRGSVTVGVVDGSTRSGRRALRRAIGWMPQQSRAVPGLTCREQVAYAGWLKGMSRSSAWSEASVALEKVDLAEASERLTSHLSGGQLRRVALAQALVARAEFLLLDEPTAGLDPGQRTRFRELLLAIDQDLPVVVSTHQVDDLDKLFDSVVVLDHGEIRFEGSVDDFLARGAPSDSRPAEAAYSALVSSER